MNPNNMIMHDNLDVKLEENIQWDINQVGTKAAGASSANISFT